MKKSIKTGYGAGVWRCLGGVAAPLLAAAMAGVGFAQDSPPKPAGDKPSVSSSTGSFEDAGSAKGAGEGEGVKEAGASGVKSTRIALNIDVPYRTTIILPRHPGPIVAFWEFGSSDGRVLSYDVRTGRQIALTQRKMALDDPVLSPDGVMLATEKRGYIKDPKAGTSVDGPTIEVWNLRTDAKVNTIEFLGKSGAKVVDFCGGTKILVAVKSTHKSQWELELWDYKANELLSVIELSKDIKEATLTADPLGKVVVYATEPWGDRDKSKIELIDVESEKPRTNQLKIKGPSDNTGGSRRSENESRQALGGMGVPLATRFSPDSKLLAVIFPGSGYRSEAGYVGVYDVQSGEQKQLINLSKGEGDSYQGFYDIDRTVVPLQWTPDAARILVNGNGLYEVESGEMLYRVAFKNDSGWSDKTPRLLFGNDYVLRSQSMKKGNNSVIKYEAVRLPTDQLQRAMQAVKMGGDALDGFLPPLKETGVKELKAQVATGTPRGVVEADPGSPVTLTSKASFPIELLDRRYQDSESQKTWTDFQKPEGILFPVTPSDKALVFGRVSKEADGDSMRPVSVIDTARGTTAWYSNETTGGMPRALAPDGRRMLVSYQRRTGERLDVYELGSGFSSPKQLVGWIPAPTARGAAGAYLAWCAMPDSGTVLTLNSSGELVGWQLPDPTPLYKIGSVDTSVMPMVSPGGKQIFFISDKRIYCASTQTGKIIADVSGVIPEPPPVPQAQFGERIMPARRVQMALSPDGKELCVTFQKRHMTCILMVYQLQESQAKTAASNWEFYDTTYSSFGNGGTARQELRYMAPGHVLLPSGLLVQTSTGSPVIFYKIWSDWWNLAQGRYWVVKWAPAQKKFMIEWTQIPSENVFKLSDRAKREDFIVYDTPVNVKVDFTVAAESNDSRLAYTVKDRLKAIGLIEDPSAAWTVKVSASVEADPSRRYTPRESTHFSPFGRQQQDGPSYEAKRMVGRTELWRTGKLIWVGDGNSESPWTIPFAKGVDPNKAIMDATWQLYPSVILQATTSFPALLMDYHRLDTVALGARVETTKGDDKKVLNELSESDIDTLNVELKCLKKYRVAADAWAKDAQDLYADLKANKLDPKKYRTEADNLQGGLKALIVPTDVMAESTRQRLVTIKEGGTQAAKLYQEAYRAAAAMSAGRRPPEGPDSLAGRANVIFEKQVKAELEAVAARVKDLEEKTKLKTTE